MRNCAKARYTQQDEIAGTEETLQDEFGALRSSVHIFLPWGALIRESHTHMVALGVCWSVQFVLCCKGQDLFVASGLKLLRVSQFPISQVAVCSQIRIQHILTFSMQSIHSALLSPSGRGGFVDIVFKGKLCKLLFKVSQGRCVSPFKMKLATCIC